MGSTKRKSEPPEEKSPDTKKAKTNYEKAPKRTDENDNEYWELTKTRRVAIQEFKGNTLVSIREYYEKDGKMLPGKSGINLKPEQFASLILALPEIAETLAEKGFSLPIPKFNDTDAEADDEPPEQSDQESVVG